MSNKEKLWKNIDWTTKEEKLAFFNKYFNSTKRELVEEEIAKTQKIFKQDLIRYINSDIEEKGKPNRKPTTQEIIEFING